MTRSRGLRGMIGLSLLSAIVTASGCGGGAGGGATPTIVVDGSSTVYRISIAAQDAFRQVEPKTIVVVDFHGTGAGFSHYLEGEIDIVDASRPAKADEEAKAKRKGSTGRDSWLATTGSRWW